MDRIKNKTVWNVDRPANAGHLFQGVLKCLSAVQLLHAIFLRLSSCRRVHSSSGSQALVFVFNLAQGSDNETSSTRAKTLEWIRFFQRPGSCRLKHHKACDVFSARFPSDAIHHKPCDEFPASDLHMSDKTV